MPPAPERPEPVVLDTNVVLDWRLFADPRAGPLWQALDAGQLRWLATAAMIDELADVLKRPLPPRWECRRERLLVESSWTDVDLVATPGQPMHGLLCADPDDQKFLDLALDQGVRWLLTRDRALLDLRRQALPLGLTIAQPQHWTPCD